MRSRPWIDESITPSILYFERTAVKMWTPVELPYFRDTYGLPAPLPTTDEIMASMTLLKDRLGQKMLRVGQHFVVKYGQDTSEVEGHNLLFVEHNLHNIVCAPRLYAMYRDADDRLFLICLLYTSPSPRDS